MRPLKGKKVLVTRPLSQAGALINQLERAGAHSVHIPLIDFQLHESKENVRILSKLHDYNWVFFTSSNGVKFFLKWLDRCGIINFPEHCKIAVVGTKTKEAAEKKGLKVNFYPSTYDGDHMAKEFVTADSAPGKVLYVRGNLSRDTISDIFVKKGILFQSITVYDTLLLKESETVTPHLSSLDALTFTSPSTVQAFTNITKECKESVLEIPCFCIGSTTAEKAAELGFEKVYFPSIFIVEEMVQQMVDYFLKEG
ncbi:uroporphyrinogen-III synthase [Halobacillus sp. Marseille-P3879]|uniref:uroporphyrinogen-III synthase n=1 Tax=Halobacillus sp. Marseille-P3879 TaxID=2045014 RepID=UPI000C7BCE3F|nr:uroporphyrinogen-III synthase [Halobacillus sp. Marseille-P3879]